MDGETPDLIVEPGFLLAPDDEPLFVATGTKEELSIVYGDITNPVIGRRFLLAPDDELPRVTSGAKKELPVMDGRSPPDVIVGLGLLLTPDHE